MSISPTDYYSAQEWEQFYAESRLHQTPFVVVNLGVIKRKYEELIRLFPYAKVYYAVKANPAIEVVSLLRDLGSNFDIASTYELDMLLNLGISPSRLSYGNTIKKAADIKYAFERGVRLFATDSLPDIENLAKYAPGSNVFFRILTEGAATAEWPLSRKFGCHPDILLSEIILARSLGLHPVGISFHVGSQQRDVGTWDSAIAKARYLFDCSEEEDIPLSLINMGGGFPAHYIMSNTFSIETYAKEIERYMKENFGDSFPQVILEPGRSLVGESGVLVSEVVMVTRKTRHSIDKWLYTDAGVFNGLIETLGESIKYPIYCEAEGEDSENFIIAGPTCDSIDVMYEKFRVPLPSKINSGDRMYWLTAGAYISSYCAVEFNGFPPLKTFFVQ